MLDVEVEGGNVDAGRIEPGSGLEVGTRALVLQFVGGNDARMTVGEIDAHLFPAVHADEAGLVVQSLLAQ